MLWSHYFYTLGLIPSIVEAIVQIIEIDPPSRLSGHTTWQIKGIFEGRKFTGG